MGKITEVVGVPKRYLLVFAVVIFSSGPASGSHNESPTLKTEIPNWCSDYVAAGQSVEGRLAVYEFMPSGWEFPHEDQRNGGREVFIRQYLWFPNPFSSPGVVVAVTEPSNFRLVLFDEAGTQLEKFEFNDVRKGVYFFTLKEPLLPVRRCTVRLFLEGVPAGEVESRTDHGSYCW